MTCYGAHPLHLRTLHHGSQLFVEGSPYAYWYGQNLFTSNDLLAVLGKILPDVLAKCVHLPSEDQIARWQAGDVALEQVDLYANFCCPAGVTPSRFIRQIARQLSERGVASRRFRNTFYWEPEAGRHYRIMFYAKGPQMRAKRSLASFPERERLLSEADNIVRVELRLKASILKSLGLHQASSWTPQMPRRVFGRFMKKLNIVNVTSGPLTDDELNALPSARLRPVLALHKAGIDIRRIYSQATIQRHMQSFRVLGVDLRCPNQPESDALPLPLLLKPSRAIQQAPLWMRKQGYAPSVR